MAGPDDNPESPTIHATASAAADAIGRLTPTDWTRLAVVARALARIRLTGTNYSWEDLLQEALLRTVAGDRRWRACVDLLKHLARTMESIASHWARKRASSPAVERLSNDEASRASTDAVAIQDELHAVRRWFAADALALSVLDCRLKGMQGMEIARALGLDNVQYATASRRILRMYTNFTEEQRG